MGTYRIVLPWYGRKKGELIEFEEVPLAVQAHVELVEDEDSESEEEGLLNGEPGTEAEAGKSSKAKKKPKGKLHTGRA